MLVKAEERQHNHVSLPLFLKLWTLKWKEYYDPFRNGWNSGLLDGLWNQVADPVLESICTGGVWSDNLCPLLSRTELIYLIIILKRFFVPSSPFPDVCSVPSLIFSYCFAKIKWSHLTPWSQLEKALLCVIN